MSTHPSMKDDLEFVMQKPFRSYMWIFKREFVIGSIALLFTNLFDILTPLALMQAIDHIAKPNATELGNAIAKYCALMVGVAIFRFLWRLYFGKFQHQVADDLRQRLFAKFTELGPSFFHRTSTGQLMSLLTSDINQFRQAIGPGVLVLLDAGLYILMIVPIMISLSWDWTWKTMLFLPLLPPFIRKMETLIHNQSLEAQNRLAEVTEMVQETVAGIRIIKGHAQETNTLNRFNLISRRFEVASNLFAKTDGAFQPAMEFVVAIGCVTLLYFCTDPVVRGTVSLGTFVAFHDYIRKMVWPMNAIGYGLSMVEQGRASFDRIREIMQTPSDLPEDSESSVDVDELRSIDVRDLSFTYPGSLKPALQNISFSISAGEIIGVVGSVASGKSTLLRLLTRMHPVASGMILINGISIEKIRVASLRRIFSLVPQESFLFSDTVFENAGFGRLHGNGRNQPDSTSLLEMEVSDATEHVRLRNEIERLPLKFQSWLGERGVNLSGGQKQRLTTARALVQKSPVTILDDSLSAVDTNTEAEITSYLRSSKGQQKGTVILVSHRFATLAHADRILFLVDGEVAGFANHHELLSENSMYRDLAARQSGTNDGHSVGADS